MTPPVVPRPVKGLGLVSLCNDFASEMVYPLLPAFITRTLGGGAIALGALDGAADLTASAVRWVSGRLADRPGWRKPLILAGYATAVLVRPLIAIASAAWQVIGFRVLDRVGKGLRTPARDALVAQLTPPAHHGRAYGFHRAADHLGAVAGSVAAWILVSRSTPVAEVIWFSALPGLAVMLVLVLVFRGMRGGREKWMGGGEGEGETREPERLGDAEGWRFWGPALALVVLTAGRLPETLLMLRLLDLGVATAVVPLAWAGLHVVRTLGAYPGGWLSDRIGPRGTLALGSILFAAVLAAMAGVRGAAGGVGIFLALGVVAGLTEGAERATIARLAPVRTGRAFGSYQAVLGAAALPFALGLGAVYQGLGGPAALTASATVVGTGAVAWWVATREDDGGR